MADVFLSYSREDRQRVEPIARGLEAEGYSVWWDPDIRPGEIWDEVIERELAAARCVVVAWSETAVQSKWVRAEATDADERRVLVPVKLDSARLPLAFKLIQAEDFRTWAGDRNADGWQRLMLQVTALCDGQTLGASLASRGGQTLGRRHWSWFCFWRSALGCSHDDGGARRTGVWRLTGMTADGILLVVYTERGERYRIITARRATPHEQDDYRRKRVLKDEGWHDDNGLIPFSPDGWEPPMTADEIHVAALSDPDAQPSTPEQLARLRRVSPARFIRRQLRMTLEGFAAYGIPTDTLRAWERHEAEPSPAELS